MKNKFNNQRTNSRIFDDLWMGKGLLIALFLILMVLPIASAGIGYQQYSTLYDSTNITRIYSYVQRGSSFGIYSTTLCFYAWCYDTSIDYSDYVPMGSPFQFYIQYGLTPIADWNIEKENNTIDYCSILVKESHFTRLANGSLIINIQDTLNQTFTALDTTATENQYRYFVSMQRGDYTEVYADCHFTGAEQIMSMPIQFSIVAPTKNCKACQYLETYKKSIDNMMGDILTGYSETLKGYMREIISLNIEIWNILFWIFKIALLLFVIGLVFLGIYWFYLFIREQMRKI
jgi:hypothetical protein